MEEVPKSPFEKRLMHKMMYKNARGKTPPWKDVYRQRCVERLRSSRSQLVDRFRSAGDAINNNKGPAERMVQDIMEIEWAAISQGSGFSSLKQLPISLEDAPKGDDEMALLALMEEIQQELLNEEERLLMEVLNHDAALLASQVALQQREEVICPVCQIQGLQEVPWKQALSMEVSGASAISNVLKCGCGLALYGANITLNTVKSSLENTVSHHSQTCGGQMSFTATTDTQGANVLITCSICDWMSFLV